MSGVLVALAIMYSCSYPLFKKKVPIFQLAWNALVPCYHSEMAILANLLSI